MNRTVMLLVLVLGAIFIFTGCSLANRLYYNPLYYTIYGSIVYPAQIGPWVNIYKGDPAIAGVCVQQYPDEESRAYAHKHPAMIIYFFWDGRNRQLEYSPHGKVIEDFWCPQLKPGDGWWNGVDFSYGSDPHFQHHKDPRIVDKKQSK